MPNIRTALSSLGLVVVTALSAGCFTSETVIKVKADGSGTIEQTHLVNSQMVGMAGAMAAAAAKEGGSTSPIPSNLDELFSEEEMRRLATQWGDGVRFVSHTLLERGAMKGASGVFAFDDVSKLSMGGRTASAGASPAGPPGPAMRFGLTTVAGRSVISVTFPETGAGASSNASAPVSSAPPPQIPPEAFAMVKSMFEGGRISVALEVDGRIVATNAPASSGARATLFAIDFGELLSDPSQLATLQTLKPGVDFDTVRKTLTGVKGVTLPTQQVVSIEFAK